MSAKPVKPKPQHAPKAPHEDPKFLESTPARPLRILAEYINPLAQLKREGIGDTIVMFGSARIHSREDTLARLACIVVSSHVCGDHTVFIGKVESVEVNEGEPLLHFRGKYRKIGEGE